MTINTDKLVSHLSKLSHEELDSILDKRDDDPFDSAWVELNKKVESDERYPDLKDIFIKISNTVNQHDITSYIADDIDLIYRSKLRGITSPFLDYIISSYKEGTVPADWKNI